MVLPQTTDLASDRRFDWQGAILLMPALAALLLTITESHAWGPTSPSIIASTAAAAVLRQSDREGATGKRGNAKQIEVDKRLRCPAFPSHEP
jgi:hypothetical protein